VVTGVRSRGQGLGCRVGSLTLGSVWDPKPMAQGGGAVEQEGLKI